MKQLAWSVAGLAITIATAQLGCGPKSGATDGAEGGKCLPNNTCNGSLSCVGAVCVRVDGGPGGSEGGATAGTSGTTGTAGASGAAGATPQPDGGGGSSIGGTGGSAGAAGSIADGGLDRPNPSDASDGPIGMEVSLVPRATCPAGPYAAFKFVTASGGALAFQSACNANVLRYAFTAGPVWVASENAFFFSAFPEDATGGSDLGDIVKYTPGAGCQTVFQDVGTNGLTVLADGHLVGASFKTRTISEFDLSTGNAKVLVDTAMGLPLDTPVDVRVHSNGTIYFSNRSSSTDGSGKAVSGVYRMDPTGTVTSISLATSLQWDGNLVLTPDEKTLFIVGGGAWSLDGMGVPSTNNQSTTPLDNGGARAGAADCAGDIYSSSWMSGGYVYMPNFQAISSAGLPQAAGLALGGADGKTLFTVNHSFLQVATTTIPGVP